MPRTTETISAEPLHRCRQQQEPEQRQRIVPQEEAENGDPRRSNVLRLIVGEGARMAPFGVLIGIGVSLAIIDGLSCLVI
jgi:hypothetical protein